MLDKLLRQVGLKKPELTPTDIAAARLNQQWSAKEEKLRKIYGDTEGNTAERLKAEVQEVAALLDKYSAIELSDDELKDRQRADITSKRGILGYQGWGAIGKKAIFLRFYEDMRSKTPALTPILTKRLLEAHSPVDYATLQIFIEDISKYNEMVVFAEVLGLVSAEEGQERLKDIGLVDTKQLIEAFKPIINQSQWHY